MRLLALDEDCKFICTSANHAAKLARALKESLNFIEQRRSLFVEESCEECGHFTSSRYTDQRAKEFLEEIKEIFK